SQRTASKGSWENSAQLHSRGCATIPSTRKLQLLVGTSGVGPAVSTGKPGSAYWPGGNRARRSAGVRRRGVKPRETNVLIASRQEYAATPPAAARDARHSRVPPGPYTAATALCVA